MSGSPITRRSWLENVTGTVLEVVYCSPSSQASRRFNQKGLRQGTGIVGSISLGLAEQHFRQDQHSHQSPSIVPSLDRINSGLTRLLFRVHYLKENLDCGSGPPKEFPVQVWASFLFLGTRRNLDVVAAREG